MIEPTPKGGRGVKAEYPTTTIRVPVALVHTFQAVSLLYRMSGTDILLQTLATVAKFKRLSRPTRDWTKLNLLIEEIEATTPADWIEEFVKR